MTLDEYRVEVKKVALATPWDDLVPFICEDCKKKVLMRSANVRKKTRLLCNPCQIRYSKSLRTEEQKKRTHEKTVATCLERYGTVNGGSSEASKAKARETWKRNWGSEEECFKKRSQKAHETFLEKYSGSYSTSEILKKKAVTLINNYGSVEESYRQRTVKAVNTNIANHGGHHNFVDPEWEEVRKQKMLEKWGVTYFAQNKEEWHKIYEKYGALGGLSGTWRYDGRTFDSFWEIAFYIHLVENKIPFVFHPKGTFKYINDNGKESYYNPDFQVGEKLYEVKGDHFFNKEGDPVDCRGNTWFNKLKYMESLGVVLVTSKVVPVNTTMEVLNIAEYLKEALDLKGTPSKYSFITSCRAPSNKRNLKKKVLYEIENTL